MLEEGDDAIEKRLLAFCVEADDDVDWWSVSVAKEEEEEGSPREL